MRSESLTSLRVSAIKRASRPRGHHFFALELRFQRGELGERRIGIDRTIAAPRGGAETRGCRRRRGDCRAGRHACHPAAFEAPPRKRLPSRRPSSSTTVTARRTLIRSRRGAAAASPVGISIGVPAPPAVAAGGHDDALMAAMLAAALRTLAFLASPLRRHLAFARLAFAPRRRRDDGAGARGARPGGRPARHTSTSSGSDRARPRRARLQRQQFQQPAAFAFVATGVAA